MSKRFLFLSVCSVILLQGCTPIGLAAGAGATAGIAASQEGGIERAVSDGTIQAKINELWFRTDLKIFQKLDLTVNNGRVLVTGIVQDPQHRVEAIRLAWQPNGVKQVINEVRVANSEGVPGFIRDNWITTRLRSSITLDRDVTSLNYNIDTVQGIVYLMGYAQSQKELNRVIETARTVPNVKQVISYVKILDWNEDVNWNDQSGYKPENEGNTQLQNNWESGAIEDPVPLTYNNVQPASGEPIFIDGPTSGAIPLTPVITEPLGNRAYESSVY